MTYNKLNLLITCSELKKRIDDVLIIDARDWHQYEEEHIPHAVNLDLFAFHFIGTSKKEIAMFNKTMSNLLASVGVSYNKFVVIYDDISGILAARGLWLLHYFSHYNCAILDGGIQEWKRLYEIERKPNIPKPTIFLPRVNHDVLATLEDVLNDNAILIDARSKEEYEGKIVRAARGGHIPNAINIDWSLNLENHKFKNIEQLTKLYNISGKNVICYCQGGFRAAHTYIALRMLGINAKVYLGSWYEYGNRLDLPIE